ncbi:hypothetical protein QZH41_015416, partial [Actinostola sp. cb2023]
MILVVEIEDLSGASVEPPLTAARVTTAMVAGAVQ